uniref:Putative secreted peptide n=1 Tax=Anopheles braziliensis TaxID=58242 RepID=A0A2M3ZPD1_9DIPT
MSLSLSLSLALLLSAQFLIFSVLAVSLRKMQNAYSKSNDGGWKKPSEKVLPVDLADSVTTTTKTTATTTTTATVAKRFGVLGVSVFG